MISILPMTSTNLMNSKEFFDLIWNDIFYEKKISLYKYSNDFKVDIKESDDMYYINADLPGISNNDISIEYLNNFLIISSIRRHVQPQNFIDIACEKQYGQLRRIFYLDNIDISGLSKHTKNGELILLIPKTK